MSKCFESIATSVAALSAASQAFLDMIGYARKDGSRVPVLLGSTTFGDHQDEGVTFVLDLTECKHVEQALRDMQTNLAHVVRITTLGELTASIAHEVNQPLAAVVNAAAACRRWLDGATPNLDEARCAVDWIVKEGNRAREVIRRVRALANKTDIEKVPLDVNDLVREAIALVQRELISQRVSLRMELAPALPMIPGDRVQLQQVIINLVMNGIEAMQSVTDRPRELVVRSGQDEAGQALISVADCGVGIAAENVDRLFNPFFTTKASGMGIGLSICRSITESHGGRLWATATVPHGATFQLTLPVNADAASEASNLPNGFSRMSSAPNPQSDADQLEVRSPTSRPVSSCLKWRRSRLKPELPEK
jgi:C4-dicarboxylate-specific signal transduction histidine kinase